MECILFRLFSAMQYYIFMPKNYSSSRALRQRSISQVAKASMAQELSSLGRAALAAGSAVMALRDPRRADLIAVLGEATGREALRRLTKRVAMSSSGRSMLAVREPRRFPSMSLEQMRSLPAGSLGAKYAAFMDVRNFDPNDRSAVYEELIPDPDQAWVLQRYRDVHDLWHVLMDTPTTILGELALKWFEAVHTGLPVAMLSATFGPFLLKEGDRKFLLSEIVPWAVKSGRAANNLIAIRYEDHLHRDVEELRKEWNLVSPRMYFKNAELFYKKKAREQRGSRDME